MKTKWKLVALVDVVVLIVSFALMVWFNCSPAYGVAALTDLGGFVVCFAVFQAALILLIVLGIAALIARWKKK